MRINSICYEDQIMTICCSGEFGIGSQGQQSADLLFDRLIRWMDDHSDKHVKMIDLDFRNVDYKWGDGPISAMVPMVTRHSVSSIRIIANARNSRSLHDLIQESKLPWFTVVDADA